MTSRNSTAKTVPHVKAVQTKTLKSLKRLKPLSPTDHGPVFVRKINNDVKIKQEFIDMVNTTKGLAPIFGSTNVTAKDGMTTTRGLNYQKDDTLPHQQSRQNDHGRGRGTGRGGRVNSREK